MPDWFLLSTIAIVLSSAFLIFAKRLVKQNKNGTLCLIVALLLGVVFSFSQFKGWESLVQQGLYMTGEGSNVASSFLYVITLSHLVHLSGGLIALLVTTINSKRGKYTADNLLGIELISIYWHYLAGLWLYLFFFIEYISFYDKNHSTKYRKTLILPGN